MTEKEKLEKFAMLVSDTPSNWFKRLEYLTANKNWLDRSAQVAVSVLEALKEKKLTQKDLAKKMHVSAQQVNKILKGQQNLTFETINKLEVALNISLITVIDFKAVAEIKTSAMQIKSVSKSINEEFKILDSTDCNPQMEKINMRVVYNKMAYNESQNQYSVAR